MVSLTIGIGANTAIFSLVNAVFIRQFPYENSEQSVRVYTVVPEPHRLRNKLVPELPGHPRL